mmetsp:Transcript_17399/g.31223  ORF Transcript_17399/g.31223 Transcript_17399/m.31223 type:complete len:243 (-) Transcript_17399:462-1190(-)
MLGPKTESSSSSGLLCAIRPGSECIFCQFLVSWSALEIEGNSELYDNAAASRSCSVEDSGGSTKMTSGGTPDTPWRLLVARKSLPSEPSCCMMMRQSGKSQLMCFATSTAMPDLSTSTRTFTSSVSLAEREAHSLSILNSLPIPSPASMYFVCQPTFASPFMAVLTSRLLGLIPTTITVPLLLGGCLPASPSDCRACLKSGGPMIWLITTIATIRVAKSEPQAGNWPFTFFARPSATPAWVT